MEIKKKSLSYAPHGSTDVNSRAVFTTSGVCHKYADAALLYSSYQHEVQTCSQHVELPDPSVGSTKHTQ